MSRPKELVCDNQYKDHDFVKGHRFWECTGCGKVRNARRPPTAKEAADYKEYKRRQNGAQHVS